MPLLPRLPRRPHWRWPCSDCPGPPQSTSLLRLGKGTPKEHPPESEQPTDLDSLLRGIGGAIVSFTPGDFHPRTRMFVNSHRDHFKEDCFEELSKASAFAWHWVGGNILVHCITILYTLHISYNYSSVSVQYLMIFFNSFDPSGELRGLLHLRSSSSSKISSGVTSSKLLDFLICEMGRS